VKSTRRKENVQYVKALDTSFRRNILGVVPCVLPCAFSTMANRDPTWNMNTVKDFLTRHILLRCDSSDDLYPVTSPSSTPHALLSVLRYIRGTLDHGLQLHVSSTSQLNAYTDADWAGCPVTRCAEAEYRGVANVVTETAWIHNLLREFHNPLFTATLVYCDNVCVLHVPSRYQYADIFTKGLSTALFEEFRTSLSVRSSPAQNAREC
nr:hypothetical protein [Tanacetum cinerariifolium]